MNKRVGIKQRVQMRHFLKEKRVFCSPVPCVKKEFTKTGGSMNIKILDLSICNASAVILLASVLSACIPIERVPQRTMGVSTGPERVFDRSVSEILPALGNAIATGNNGRVGNELVFWEYRFTNNQRASLYACALLEDINCDLRSNAVCPAGGEELGKVVEPGKVRELRCRPVGIARVGELRPNCVDGESNHDLQVGLLQCR